MQATKHGLLDQATNDHAEAFHQNQSAEEVLLLRGLETSFGLATHPVDSGATRVGTTCIWRGACLSFLACLNK